MPDRARALYCQAGNGPSQLLWIPRRSCNLNKAELCAYVAISTVLKVRGSVGLLPDEPNQPAITSMKPNLAGVVRLKYFGHR